MAAAIELTQPRIISIRQGKRQFKLTLGRISKRDWLKYFEGILSTAETVDGKRVESFDASGARVELVEKNLIAAEGYATADGSPVTATDGWQKLIPMPHRLAAGEALTSVGPSEVGDDDERPLVLGRETVILDAVWSADDKGTMQKFRGLRHIFRTPGADHQRRYSRDRSRSVVTGGSRTGRTRWLGAQATLVELYDELIDSIEGYTLNGSGLTGASIIAAEMDTYHKAAAADALFSPSVPAATEVE